MLSVEALADIKEEGSTTDAFTSTVLNGNNRDHRLSDASGSYRDDCFQYVFVFEFPRQLRQLSHIRASLSIIWNYLSEIALWDVFNIPFLKMDKV